MENYLKKFIQEEQKVDIICTEGLHSSGWIKEYDERGIAIETLNEKVLIPWTSVVKIIRR